jgi:hypothetical protein
MNLEAVVFSVDEPQLDRCLKAAKEQTVPFKNIFHINNVVPEHESFAKGLKLITEEQFMRIDGDLILYPNAIEIVTWIIKRHNDSRVFYYVFGVLDTFLEVTLLGCPVLKTSAYRSIDYKNKLSSDRYAVRSLRKMGLVVSKHINSVIATHFDNPDEFQVFRRFFTMSIKHDDNSFVIKRMTELFERTGNPLYLTGLNAVYFAKKDKYYPGSHDIDFERKKYEEFKMEAIV